MRIVNAYSNKMLIESLIVTSEVGILRTPSCKMDDSYFLESLLLKIFKFEKGH